MNRRNVVLSAVAVCCAGGAAFFAWRALRTEREDLLPAESFWVCQGCKQEFVKPGAALAEGAVTCPKCNAQRVVRGLRCPSCTRIFVRESFGQPVCPYCKKPFPPATGAGG